MIHALLRWIILVDRGPTLQRDLVTGTGWDKAGIMRVVDDLESRCLVVRKPVPGDRRVRLVEITARGRKVTAPPTPTTQKA